MSWTIIFLYILSVIFLLSFIRSILNLYGDEGNGVISVIFYGMLFIVTLCTAITTHKSPQAIDVYQDKTTLEYKVVDDVKVDSVVIFKTMHQD